MFTDPELRRALQLVHDAVRIGGADACTVRAVAARIPDGDADAWVEEWAMAGGAAWAAGHDAAAREGATARHRARGRYLHAASYYGAALAAVARAAAPARGAGLSHRQRSCWDRAAARFPVPAQRIAINYERTTLPGYFFPAPDAAPGEHRATVIINNDLSGATSQAWVRGGAATAARGLHWMTFDGPGQEAARVEQSLLARPDWEAVLTPVLDALLARDDVDPTRVAAVGLGTGGGHLVLRAISAEHRLAAAIVPPGAEDLGATWRALLSPPLDALLRAGDDDAFDREIHLLGLFDPALRARLRACAVPFAADPETISAAAVFRAVGRFRMDHERRAQIRMPLLIADDDESPRVTFGRLAERLGG